MKKIVFFCVAFLVLLIASVFIRQFYLQWKFSKNLVTEVIDFPVVFQDDKNVIDISQLKDKFVVLYFFDSECSDKDISKFRKKYDDSRIKDDDSVIIYSIDCYLDKEFDATSTMSGISKKNGDMFPTLSLNKNDNLLKMLKINSFPTVLIINREGNICYRGSTGLALSTILGLTYAI